MKRIRKRRIVAQVLGVLVILSIAASFYFFNVAQVRGDKTAITGNSQITKSHPLYAYDQAFNKLDKQTLTMTNQGVKQEAWYIPAAEKTDKTVIVVHGFTSDKSRMKPYGYLFHKLGYNVLMPDNMAHGNSSGRIIGYGWNDRLNVMKWIDILIAQQPTVQIDLFGISMGGATVMMTSGESLPNQVKAIIEDSGYTSVWDELSYEAKQLYHLPAFPILYEVSAISKVRAGFSYGQASSVKQLAKNQRPTLFIHGDEDTFVPTWMVYKNYKATAGPKELYIGKGAGHVQSFMKNPAKYEEVISTFLKKYDK